MLNEVLFTQESHVGTGSFAMPGHTCALQMSGGTVSSRGPSARENEPHNVAVHEGSSQATGGQPAQKAHQRSSQNQQQACEGEHSQRLSAELGGLERLLRQNRAAHDAKPPRAAHVKSAHSASSSQGTSVEGAQMQRTDATTLLQVVTRLHGSQLSAAAAQATDSDQLQSQLAQALAELEHADPEISQGKFGVEEGSCMDPTTGETSKEQQRLADCLAQQLRMHLQHMRSAHAGNGRHAVNS